MPMAVTAIKTHQPVRSISCNRLTETAKLGRIKANTIAMVT